MTTAISAPISVGELYDKISILEIKLSRIEDESKLVNISHELSLLRILAQDKARVTNDELFEELLEVNTRLWDVEDALREHEASQSFGEDFVRLARSVYHLNDRRSAIKRKINIASGSDITEEKSYKDYASADSLLRFTQKTTIQ